MYYYTNTDTTDVQLITVDFDKRNTSILVQCDFIPGSEAQGCMVILVGELYNTTFNLERSDTVATQYINVTCPSINYVQVIGHDVESDHSIGSLAVHGKLLFNNSIILCSQNTMNHDLESNTGPGEFNINYDYTSR